MSYIQNTDEDRSDMLRSIGASSIGELFETLEDGILVEDGLDLPPPLSEAEVASLFRRIASKNHPASCMASFLGGGIYDRYIPAVVRYVLSRGEFYTSYTPYQAEVSQGTLQAIYEYQTMISRLTGMEAANASLYDGATALAESVIMSCAIKRKSKVLVPRALHPGARAVLESYSKGKSIDIGEVPFLEDGSLDTGMLERSIDGDTSAVVISQPNYFGIIEKAPEISDLVHSKGALLVSYVDPVSLAVLAPPGEYDADIVVGEGQSLGNPQNFGGPLLGFMATKKSYIRKCPGRLISGAVDKDGSRGYVMTLQTREQHIRREKATSNICTNEGLCALSAAVYLSALGEKGFREVAVQSMSKAHALHSMLSDSTYCDLPFSGEFFQEFVIRVSVPAADFCTRAREAGVLAGIPLERDFPELGNRSLLVAVTEKRTKDELQLYRSLIEEIGGSDE